MQIFLPYPNFKQSAQVLDNQRAIKQSLECVSIYNTLTGKSEAWQSHPIMKMWKNCHDAVAFYHYFNICELFARNINVSPDSICDKDILIKEKSIKYPDWFNDERLEKVCSSTRSRLLFKGRVDAAAYSLRKFLKVRSINTWFSENGYPQKNVFTHKDIERLERKCLDLGVTISDNHYSKFGWTEDDTQKYYWPV